jgi:hypothetical protein
LRDIMPPLSQNLGHQSDHRNRPIAQSDSTDCRLDKTAGQSFVNIPIDRVRNYELVFPRVSPERDNNFLTEVEVYPFPDLGVRNPSL